MQANNANNGHCTVGAGGTCIHDNGSKHNGHHEYSYSPLPIAPVLVNDEDDSALALSVDDAAENGVSALHMNIHTSVSKSTHKHTMDSNLVKRNQAAVVTQVDCNGSGRPSSVVAPQSVLSSTTCNDESTISLISSFEIEHRKYGKFCTAQNQYIIYGMKISKKNLGILCAFFNGLWGGSQTIPLHFSE